MRTKCCRLVRRPRGAGEADPDPGPDPDPDPDPVPWPLAPHVPGCGLGGGGEAHRLAEDAG